MLSVFVYIAVRKFFLQFASTRGVLFLSIVNTLTFSLVLDYLLNSNFLHKSLFNVTLLFCSFWFVSIFIFLYKKSLYSTHTTVIQRFWKRTLYLFWVIELFLFMIYMYLVLVAPTEVEWLLDQPQLFRTKQWHGLKFFKKLLKSLWIIFFLNNLSLILVNTNISLLRAYACGTTVVISSLSYNDFYELYIMSTYYCGLSWEYDEDLGCWDIDEDMEKTRVMTHYYFLVTVLKFWHTAFILIFWLFSF